MKLILEMVKCWYVGTSILATSTGRKTESQRVLRVLPMQAANFLETINNNFWTQNVEDWTHLRDTDHPSRLDLVFTKTADKVDDIKYLPPLGLSRHAVLGFTITVTVNTRVQEDHSWKLNYFKADKEKMRRLFYETDWDAREQRGC